MLLDRFKEKTTFIMTFLLNLQMVIEKIEKLQGEGKKALENIINSNYQLNLLKNTNDFLFKNVDNLVSFTLNRENEWNMIVSKEILSKISELYDSFEKNFRFLYENFLYIGTGKQIRVEISIEEIAREFFVDLEGRKEVRKVFLLMKLIANSWGISKDFQKDLVLKREIIKMFEDPEKKLDELKYCLELWVYCSFINEKLFEEFSSNLKFFSKI